MEVVMPPLGLLRGLLPPSFCLSASARAWCSGCPAAVAAARCGVTWATTCAGKGCGKGCGEKCGKKYGKGCGKGCVVRGVVRGSW